MRDASREVTGADISVNLAMVKTDQLYGLKKPEALEKQKSHAEVGALSGPETRDVLKDKHKKLAFNFIQSWLGLSSSERLPLVLLQGS